MLQMILKSSFSCASRFIFHECYTLILIQNWAINGLLKCYLQVKCLMIWVF